MSEWAHKLLISREGKFHFMREPAIILGCVTGSMSWLHRMIDASVAGAL
jgi:hypothetical protein